jgi:hypothetical protein
MPGAHGTVLDESAAIGTSLLNCDLVRFWVAGARRTLANNSIDLPLVTGKEVESPRGRLNP